MEANVKVLSPSIYVCDTLRQTEVQNTHQNSVSPMLKTFDPYYWWVEHNYDIIGLQEAKTYCKTNGAYKQHNFEFGRQQTSRVLFWSIVSLQINHLSWKCHMFSKSIEEYYGCHVI